MQSTIYSRPTFPYVTSAITGASPWNTDGKKSLPNLQYIAPKQDEVRVPEMWSSCVHGTLSNLQPKFTAERKASYAFWFLLYSTLQRCHWVKDVCLQALWLCVQVLSTVTLVREVYRTLVSLKTLLLLCRRCVNSKQALQLLHVWNHFVFPCFDRFCAAGCQILS